MLLGSSACSQHDSVHFLLFLNSTATSSFDCYSNHLDDLETFGHRDKHLCDLVTVLCSRTQPVACKAPISTILATRPASNILHRTNYNQRLQANFCMPCSLYRNTIVAMRFDNFEKKLHLPSNPLYLCVCVCVCLCDVCVCSLRIYLVSPADINECEQGGHNCDMNAQCDNTVGSFECHCNAGFTGNGTNCDGK